MSRSYDRDAKHYDRAVLNHLVETGAATFFAAAGVYVVKTEDGSFAVRPHQIVETSLVVPAPTVEVEVEVRVASPMDGYSCKEQYDLEDAGPGGVVYDGAVALAEQYCAAFNLSIDPLEFVRRILDDETGQYQATLREQIAEIRTPARPACRRADEAAELLKHFGG